MKSVQISIIYQYCIVSHEYSKAMLGIQERVWLSEWIIVEYNRELTEGRIGGCPLISWKKIYSINELNVQGLSLRKIVKEVGVHHGRRGGIY